MVKRPSDQYKKPMGNNPKKGCPGSSKGTGKSKGGKRK